MPSLSPSLNLLLGGSISVTQTSEIEPPQLPTKIEAEALFQRYLEAVSPLAHVLHIPSFKRLFDRFWIHIDIGSFNQNSGTALILAVCMAAAASFSQLQAKSQFGISKEELFLRLQKATERALLRANWAKTSNIRTLQALTIYLVQTPVLSIRKMLLIQSDTAMPGADISCNICYRRRSGASGAMHRYTSPLSFLR